MNVWNSSTDIKILTKALIMHYSSLPKMVAAVVNTYLVAVGFRRLYALPEDTASIENIIFLTSSFKLKSHEQKEGEYTVHYISDNNLNSSEITDSKTLGTLLGYPEPLNIYELQGLPSVIITIPLGNERVELFRYKVKKSTDISVIDNHLMRLNESLRLLDISARYDVSK